MSWHKPQCTIIALPPPGQRVVHVHTVAAHPVGQVSKVGTYQATAVFKGNPTAVLRSFGPHHGAKAQFVRP
jgi:hypothetical protein